MGYEPWGEVRGEYSHIHVWAACSGMVFEDLLFVVLFFDKIPKKCQFKFKFVNAQLHGKQIIC